MLVDSKNWVGAVVVPLIFGLVLASDLAACSSNDPVPCPAQIPIGDRSSCHYPETQTTRRYQYVCGYQLPCGEATTCTCVPDSARWYCNVDCPPNPNQSCELSVAGYTC